MSAQPTHVAQGPSPEPSPRRNLSNISSAFLAAAIYTGLSLVAGLVFLAVTVAFGDYDWVARIGGAIWTFALCMIILMPTITPWIRERTNR